MNRLSTEDRTSEVARQHEKKSIELLRQQIPALPKPYYDWLKTATKNGYW